MNSADNIPSDHDTRVANETIDVSYRDFYITNRMLEFCADARDVLWNRIQPRQLKNGRNLVLPSCPVEILREFFSMQPECCVRTTQRKATYDGIEYNVPHEWFIFNDCMPDLGGRWASKYYKRGTVMYHAYYTYIAFIVNTMNNRVYCNYTQICTMMWNDQRFLVPG